MLINRLAPKCQQASGLKNILEKEAKQMYLNTASTNR
jgi:hypothetical protein